MEKGRRDESMRGEKSRKGVEIARYVVKKERGEQTESKRRRKMFCLWMFWAYCSSLQKCRGRGICTDTLK